MAKSVAYRICPFCEATCGLRLEIEGREVVAVRGDEEDVFSQGFVCPKGVAIAELDRDPDRLRQPLIRRDGQLQPATWDEAFAEIEQRLPAVAREHGKDSIAVYLGNPTVHNISLSLYSQVFLRALRSINVYSASTVDQIPKQLASALMFGTYTSIAVPDIERTELLVVFGADPFESNGSLWTVPDFPRRLRELQARGGKCWVFDPRRSRTAEAADRHWFLRPGTDALLLMAIVNVLFEDSLVADTRLREHVAGVEEVRAVSKAFTPERVADACGVPASEIREVAHAIAAAPRAAVYGRIGTCTQEFGTTASWLIDVINVLTGNLDRPGGVMFPKGAGFAPNTYGASGVGAGVRTGRRFSRVSKAPEVMGEFPVGCLTEEIETDGAGQVHALVVIGGNPVLSTPNGPRLEAAIRKLDFVLSLDIYLNETSRLADVVLPGLSPLEAPHFDAVFPQFGYRNALRYSAPIFASADQPAEWQSLLRLTAILTGQGRDADLEALDDFVAMTQIQKAVTDEHSPVFGRDAGELLDKLSPLRGPERLIDIAIRTGPHGDGFGANSDGVSMEALRKSPHGIDLGELRARIPEALRTPSGKIELAPAALIDDVARLAARLDQGLGSEFVLVGRRHLRSNNSWMHNLPKLAGGRERCTLWVHPEDATRLGVTDGAQVRVATSVGEFVLVGRRHLRSNNSWMHNLPKLAGGRERCTLWVHPEDATRLGVTDGAQVRVATSVGEVVVAAELTDKMMPGVVSLPHGWGHDAEGAHLSVARKRPGVNSNRLADGRAVDPVSGNAVLNGIPVTVESLHCN